jgi:23S rRNA pseudouridine2605 synthase
MAEERLQKILAQAGFGSRRANEELIRAGRVRVNGQIAILGSKADAEIDRIDVDGKPIRAKEKPIYIALNKPRGVLSDEDPNDPRSTVIDLVPVSGHLFSVGRLDLDSEGLILLTNDGDLAHHLTHPRYEHEKEYHVQVASQPDEEQLEIWRRGVVLEDGGRTAPAEVKVISSTSGNAWLQVIMHEGKKRQIREVGKRIGLPVKRIIRTRIGTLLLGNLKPGEWRNLKTQEVDSLKTLTNQERPGKPKLRARLKGYQGKKESPRSNSKSSGLKRRQ